MLSAIEQMANQSAPIFYDTVTKIFDIALTDTGGHHHLMDQVNATYVCKGSCAGDHCNDETRVTSFVKTSSAVLWHVKMYILAEACK